MDKQLGFIDLKTLFNDYSDKYIIPIYQRNYAWTHIEIQQLLSDLLNTSESDTAYFLGSLVVQKKTDTTYEVIDGQQRLTTLFLLNECLRLLFPDVYNGKSFHLRFEHRKASEDILNGLKDLSPQELDASSIDKRLEEKLKEKSENELRERSGLIAGIRSIEKFLRELSQDEQEQLCAFLSLKQKKCAYLLRTELPSHIDKNHYFEKMNARGVQLEAQELLKAKMMDALEKNDAEITLFSLIWDACADMSRFAVQQLYSKLKSTSEEVFSESGLLKSEMTFDKLAKIYTDSNHKLSQNSEDSSEREEADNGNSAHDSKKVGRTMKFLFAGDISENTENQVTAGENKRDPDEAKGSYQSVINFPNFLLQVLSIYLNKNNTSDENAIHIRLDDKFLLEEFSYAPKVPKSKEKPHFDKPEKVKEFIMHLLKMRCLFDCYVLKMTEKEDKEKWGIWSWKKSAKNNYYSVETFSKEFLKESEKKSIESILQLQSMLHVSFNTQTYKKWLLKVLDFLNNATMLNKDFVKTFKEELEKIAAELFKEQYSDVDDVVQYLQDAQYPNITHYTFHYLDYLIWKAFQKDESSKDLLLEKSKQEDKGSVEKLQNAIKNFTFKHRSSVEHYYPQNPASIPPLDKDEEGEKKLLHSLGNLCLISGYQNGKLYNSSPEEKRREVLSRLEHTKGIDSAKQALMMMYKQWTDEDITDHQEKVLTLLENERKDLKK